MGSGVLVSMAADPGGYEDELFAQRREGAKGNEPIPEFYARS